MRPEAKVRRRGDRSAPDFSWLFASSAMYVASLTGMTREKRNHIRHHQPQKPTVRESGVAPRQLGEVVVRTWIAGGLLVAWLVASVQAFAAGWSLVMLRVTRQAAYDLRIWLTVAILLAGLTVWAWSALRKSKQANDASQQGDA